MVFKYNSVKCKSSTRYAWFATVFIEVVMVHEFFDPYACISTFRNFFKATLRTRSLTMLTPVCNIVALQQHFEVTVATEVLHLLCQMPP